MVISLEKGDHEDLKDILHLAPSDVCLVEFPVIFDDKFKNLPQHATRDAHPVGFSVILTIDLRVCPRRV
jgi:hypothetical protein